MNVQEKAENCPIIDSPYPYLFDGITEDEKCFEHFYLMTHPFLLLEKKYKPLVKQIVDGDIEEVPVENYLFTPSYIKDNNWRYTKETFYEYHPQLINE